MLYVSELAARQLIFALVELTSWKPTPRVSYLPKRSPMMQAGLVCQRKGLLAAVSEIQVKAVLTPIRAVPIFRDEWL